MALTTNDPIALHPDVMELPCRVCLQEGSLNVYDSSFDTEDGEIRIADAIDEFSVIQSDILHTFPVHICYDCTNQLIVAHQFMMKLRKSEQHYLGRKERRKEAIVDEHPLISPKARTVSEDENKTPTDSIFIIEEILSNDVEKKSEDVTPIVIPIIKPEPASISSRQKPNIVVSETVASLLKKSGFVTSQQVRQDVAATREAAAVKRKHEVERFEASSSAKRMHRDGHQSPTTHVMVPQFVITDRPTTTKSSNENRIKQLEMISLHVSVATLNRFNFSDLATNHAEHPASPKSIFMCTFCPKAYATSPLLIMHTRKSHICQFCLRGYVQLSELQEHIRTAHVLVWCALCNQQFHCNSNLRAHIKRSHGIQLPAQVSLLTQMDDISEEVLIVMDADELE